MVNLASNFDENAYYPFTGSILDEQKYNNNTGKSVLNRLQCGIEYEILDGLSINSKFQYEKSFDN